jgi:hypothetical protein
LNASDLVVCVTDSQSAVVATSVLLNPSSYSSSGVASKIVPLIVTAGTLIRLFLRYPSGATWLDVEDGTFRVYGCDKIPNASGVYPAGSIFWRLDASTFTAASTTLTAPYTTDQTINGSSVKVTTPMSNAGYLLGGAKSVLVLVDTAIVFDGLSPLGTIVPIVAQVL